MPHKNSRRINFMHCPRCGFAHTKKNGSIHNKKQKYQCNECKYQFVENPQNKIISDGAKNLIEKLLLEKIPLAGIARVTDVSEPWLQAHVNEKYTAVPQVIKVTDKPKGRITIQCDEMWSFVGNKDNKQWIWLAIDRDTRECVGCFVGSRDRAGALGLWDSLPGVYRQCAIAYTDFWASYDEIFPDTRHRSVGKETGKTNYIERFNCTLRQRISRLVRKTLSFSKKLENHIGAIWYFIHHYNDEIRNNFAA